MDDLALLAAAAALLSAWAFAARRFRHARVALRRLLEGTRALSRGDLSHRLVSQGATGAPGVIELFAEFNVMTDALRRRQEELERAREEAEALRSRSIAAREHGLATLEEKVRERTFELRKAYDELKKLDEMKDSFLSSVSHELRTPLSSIRSFSEILLTYEGDEETRREFLGIINQESERLTRLINDVLDLAKIESGRMEWRLEPVSLAEVCAEAIAPMSVLARNKRHSLLVDVPEGLPNVLADRDRLIQVFENLVSNAIKFTGEGGTIRVIAERAPGLARVTIADDGIGIPGAEIRMIFEKFKQVGDTLTGKPTGTGLGLPISREIIQHLGGALWAESAPGRGSRFLFTLPLASGSARASERGEEDLRGRAGSIPEGAGVGLVAEGGPDRKWVGVADDDAGTVAVLREMLSLRGYGVLTAANGEEALTVARGHELELLILDLNMPRKSGWRVLEELRSDARTRSLPVIVLTGMEVEMDRARALALGAVEYLEKGRGLARLTAEIDLLVRRSL